MTPRSADAMLLATVEPLRLMTGEPDQNAVWWPWIAAVGIAAAIAILAIMLRRWHVSRMSDGDRALRRLAAACGLSRDEIAAVQDGARLLGIAPAGLLLSDAALARVAEHSRAAASPPAPAHAARPVPAGNPADHAESTPRRPRSINTSA